MQISAVVPSHPDREFRRRKTLWAFGVERPGEHPLMSRRQSISLAACNPRLLTSPIQVFSPNIYRWDPRTLPSVASGMPRFASPADLKGTCRSARERCCSCLLLWRRLSLSARGRQASRKICGRKGCCIAIPLYSGTVRVRVQRQNRADVHGSRRESKGCIQRILFCNPQNSLKKLCGIGPVARKEQLT